MDRTTGVIRAERGPRTGERPVWPWLLALAVVAAIAGWAIVDAIVSDRPGSEGVTIEEILADPDEYVGQEVVVGGGVGEQLGSNALTVGDDELLVVEAQFPEGLDANDAVLVSGTVERLSSLDHEARADLGLGDLELDERPIVVAERVTLLTGLDVGD